MLKACSHFWMPVINYVMLMGLIELQLYWFSAYRQNVICVWLYAINADLYIHVHHFDGHFAGKLGLALFPSWFMVSGHTYPEHAHRTGQNSSCLDGTLVYIPTPTYINYHRSELKNVFMVWKAFLSLNQQYLSTKVRCQLLERHLRGERMKGWEGTWKGRTLSW